MKKLQYLYWDEFYLRRNYTLGIYNKILIKYFIFHLSMS